MALAYEFPRFYRWVDRNFFDDAETSPLSDMCAEMMAVETLEPGSVVIDLACGTGTVASWIAAQRPDVRVVGVDAAPDMVEDARRAGNADGLDNLTFVGRSATALTMHDIAEAVGATGCRVEMIVSSYGFSAMRDRDAAIDATLRLLSPGGRYVIIDLHYRDRNLLSRFMTRVVDPILWGSNQLAPAWQLLPCRLDAFEKRARPVKLYNVVPAVFFAARGIKP